MAKKKKIENKKLHKNPASNNFRRQSFGNFMSINKVKYDIWINELYVKSSGKTEK